MKDLVRKGFKKHFGSKPIVVRSPGRINLIGEHTDYNLGLVMPGAIKEAIWFAMAPNGGSKARVHALDLDDYFEFDVSDLSKTLSPWGMYVKGVVAQFRGRIPGFDCVFAGNIPRGGGLSSSAALTCGIAFGLDTLFDCKLSKWELASLAQRAEQEFARVDCGIMDQFASLFGVKGDLLMLDCENYSHTQVQLPKGLSIFLIDSGVKHSLAATEYNLRKQECEMAVSILRRSQPDVVSLRNATLDMIENEAKSLGERLTRRVTYVIEENERVKNCQQLIEQGKPFGQLLYASHDGLRDKYSVSCDEVDVLVSSAKKAGVYGARIMGGGFGGYTINVIERGGKRQLREVRAMFKSVYGYQPEMIEVSLENGTSVL